MKLKELLMRHGKQLTAAGLALLMLSGTTLVATANAPIKSTGAIDYMDRNDPSKVVRFYASDLEYLNDAVEEQIVAVTDGKGKIADAIRGKDSAATVTASSSFDDLSSAVKNIGASATAGVGDVLAGKTVYTAEGYKKGKMKNLGGQRVELTEECLAVDKGMVSLSVLEAGYYDTASTLCFSTEAIKKSVLGLNGNVTADQVLSGKTFYNTSLDAKTGTMPNYANKTQTANVSASGSKGTVTIPAAGYYDTTSKLTVDVGSMVNLTGNVSADQVLAGKKYYSNSLTAETGTMKNYSGVSSPAPLITNGNTGIVKIPVSGYYDATSSLSIDLTANNDVYYNKGLEDAEITFDPRYYGITKYGSFIHEVTTENAYIVATLKASTLGGYVKINDQIVAEGTFPLDVTDNIYYHGYAKKGDRISFYAEYGGEAVVIEYE